MLFPRVYELYRPMQIEALLWADTLVQESNHNI